MGPRKEDRHQLILEAALELVAEVGYDGMSMDAVAARARASKATIYRHWPGKAQLVTDAMRCHADVGEVPDTGSLAEDLRALVRAGCRSMTATDGVLVVELLSASLRDPDLGQVMRSSMIETKSAATALILKRAQERGEIPDDADVQLINDVLPGALFFHVVVLGNSPSDAFADRLVDDILVPLLQRHA